MSHATVADGPARASTPEAGPLFDEPARKVTFEIPEGTEQSTCRGCGEAIFWIVTTAGKRMPVNADGTSHFATCPKAASFRREPREAASLNMDLKTAIVILVAFIEAAPAWDREAEAARVVLVELKAQGIREKEVGAALDELTAKLDALEIPAEAGS